MNLRGKVIFITGASSGIGEACARQFAAAGANLLLSARRIEKLENLASDLRDQYKIDVKIIKLDVCNRKQVAEMFNSLFNSLPKKWQTIAVLINNAGLARGMDFFQDGNIDDWEEMIDTNLKGLLYVSRAIIPEMIKRKTGHIINIGSTAGHWTYPKGNVYCATKHAVVAFSESLRMDLMGTNLRVSCVSPGLCATEFSTVRFSGDKNKADATYKGMKPLSADDVANAVFYCANLPSHINISDLIIMPTAQASVNHIYRKQ